MALHACYLAGSDGSSIIEAAASTAKTASLLISTVQLAAAMADAASQLVLLQSPACPLQDNCSTTATTSSNSSSSSDIRREARLPIVCSIITADSLLHLHCRNGPNTLPAQQQLQDTPAFMQLMQMLLAAAVEMKLQQQQQKKKKHAQVPDTNSSHNMQQQGSRRTPKHKQHHAQDQQQKQQRHQDKHEQPATPHQLGSPHHHHQQQQQRQRDQSCTPAVLPPPQQPAVTNSAGSAAAELHVQLWQALGLHASLLPAASRELAKCSPHSAAFVSPDWGPLYESKLISNLSDAVLCFVDGICIWLDEL
jgi:hypothetical protein